MKYPGNATLSRQRVQKPMHVAFWSPAWPLERYPNGIITYVRAVKGELENRGHRVTVFTGVADESAASEGIIKVQRSRAGRLLNRILRRSGGRAAFNLSEDISAAILREHRLKPIDIIEMEESFGWCGEVRKRTALPMVVKLHGPAFLSLVESELSTPFAQAKISREGRGLHACNAIISPSRSTLEQTVTRYGLTEKRTRVIVNPVSAAGAPAWSLNTCDRSAILYVGRFDRRKGADVILQAFAIVLAANPQARLIFVGPDAGWTRDDGAHVDFAGYCDTMFPKEVRKRIDFRGRMSNRDIATLRTQAMVTVIASRWENQSYALLEAMLQGCPVVSTNAGGCPESIIDGRNGRLAASEDPEDFARKLSAILRDAEGAAAMGQAARKFVQREHSVTAVVDSMLEYYARELEIAAKVTHL
jgi:glycosyltransferase involved in cell wall biosynthesis